MAFPVTQPFKRTTKSLRFEDDVLTKSQMLQATDDDFETGYVVVDKDTLEQYVYNSNATPSATTGKFVKMNSSGGEDLFFVVPTDRDNWQDVPAQGEGVKGIELTSPYTYEELVASGKQIAVKINETSKNSDSFFIILQHYDDNAQNKQFYGFSTYSDWVEGVQGYYMDTVQIVKQTQTDKTWLYFRTSEITGGSLPAGGTTGQVLAKKSDADGDTEWIDGSGIGMTQTVLWENQTITTWVAPVLSDSVRNYDILLFEGWQQDGKWCQSFLNVKDLGIGENKDLLINGYSWITIKFTDDTHIVGVNGTPNATVVCRKVTGITFGSSLDGTIGRWEKIGEWQEGGVPKDYTIANMSDYNAFSFEVLRRNGFGWYNTALILSEDFGIGEKVAITGTDDVEVWIERIDATTIRRSYQNGGTAVGIRMYGYKETAISDADVQKIASQVPLVSIQVTTLPTASATEEGNIYQYVGQTDSNYTNGYFYQCVEVTPATDPKTYKWDQKNVQSDGGGGSLPAGGTTGQALVKKSDTDGDVERKTVGGESTIDVIKVNGITQTITNKEVDIEVPTLSVSDGLAKISNQSDNSFEFSPLQAGLEYTSKINNVTDTNIILASKNYVDSKSPTIVNEGATFTNAVGNQKMQIRTGGADSVIIKDTNGDGTTEYWSHEVPNKTYVDNAVSTAISTANNTFLIIKDTTTYQEILNAFNAKKGLLFCNSAVVDGTSYPAVYALKQTDHILLYVHNHPQIIDVWKVNSDDTYEKTREFVLAENQAIKDYVDGKVGDLTTLTTTDKTDLVSAINEVYEKSGEPFRIKNWASSSLNVTIEPCTTDKSNGELAKMVFTIDEVEGAAYQIVGMISYEIFDNTSGGNRLNVWPVCQFTGNGQKELSVRWVCAGSTAKTAKRINAWVLLKHR